MQCNKFLLIFILIASTAINSMKCEWLGQIVGEFFKDAINNATEPMILNAKLAFRESMDYVFDNKISPLINQIEAISYRIMDREAKEIKQMTNDLKEQIGNMVNNAATKATELVDHTVDEIKENIIKETFDQMTKFEDK